MAGICTPQNLDNIFADVGFDRVTLSTVENVDPARIGNPDHEDGPIALEDLTTQVSINCYIRERVSAEAASWYQQGDILNFLRLRVLTCVSDQNPAGLDFISQRFNEYQNFHGKFLREGEETRVSPKNFIEGAVQPYLAPLRQNINGETIALGNHTYLLDNLGETSIYMPYQSADPTAFLRNRPGVKQGFEIYKYPGAPGQPQLIRQTLCHLRDIIVYDKPLSDILPQRLNPDTQEMEVVSRSLRETIPANSHTGQPMMALFEQAPVLPIEFRLGPGTDIEYTSRQSTNTLEHLSLYGFVYLDYTSYREHYNLPPGEGPNQLNLETGTGQSTNITLLGKKYQYREITKETPKTPRNLVSILDAPDASILQDVRIGKTPYLSAASLNYYQDAYVSFDGSSLAQDPVGQSIHREDFFTDFWGTPDFENNTRYLVGFNLVKFLAQKSQFPGLYTNPSVVNKLIHDGVSFKFAGGSDPHIYRSAIQDFRVGKQFVDPIAFYNSNDLGTLSAKKPKKPDYNYTNSYLHLPPRLVDFKLLFLNEDLGAWHGGGFYFYEGTDYHHEERVSQTSGEYQYFCEVTVSDIAPILLLKATKELRESAHNLRSQLNQILDPLYGVYDPVVRKFVKPLAEVPYLNTDARHYALEQLSVYIDYLKLFNIQVSVGEWHQGRGVLWLENHLQQRISEAVYPDELETIIRYIEVFATDIAATASIYYNIQMGYQEEADFAKRDSLLKGIFEHEFAMLTHKNTFNNTYSFGIKNGLGYSYVALDDTEMYRGVLPKVNFGLGLYSIPQYLKRIQSEINKYYYDAQHVGDGSVSLNQVPGEWGQSLYKYLTPRVIHAQGGRRKNFRKDINPPGGLMSTSAGPIIQTDYLSSDVLKYDVDHYASVFADLIKSKYATKYLNLVFYQNHDELPNDHPNVKIYNSLLKVLGEEFSCEVALGSPNPYTVPTNVDYRTAGNNQSGLPGEQLLPLGALDPNIISNPQAILGGRGDQSEETQSIIEGIQSRYKEGKSQEINDEDTKYLAGGKQSPALPIKLVFGILGELELNNHIDTDIYQNDLFNSLSRLAENLNITEGSLPADIGGRYKNLPLQVKAMLIMSVMTQRVDINGLAVKRFRANDHDAVTEDRDAIKYYDNRTSVQIQNPPYKNLYDPMKTYAKFLPFWLNFKQLIKVEYLQGFSSTDAPISHYHPESTQVINFNSPSRPLWQELTMENYDRMFESQKEGKILCRIADIVPQAFIASDEGNAGNNTGNEGDSGDMDNSGPLTSMEEGLQKALVATFKGGDVLDLPIYHQYFFLGNEGGDR